MLNRPTETNQSCSSDVPSLEELLDLAKAADEIVAKVEVAEDTAALVREIVQQTRPGLVPLAALGGPVIEVNPCLPSRTFLTYNARGQALDLYAGREDGWLVLDMRREALEKRLGSLKEDESASLLHRSPVMDHERGPRQG